MNEILSDLDRKTEEAIEFIRRLDSAVVALSAGVDSSLVALLSRKALGEKTVAVTGVSESLAAEELAIARRVAGEIGIRHLVVQTDELGNPSYLSNQGDRCYHCKRTLYTELRAIADECDFKAVLDGTQTDDLSDIRPGLRAAREAGVKSPLLEVGFNKSDVRQAARLFGLSVWDKPAMPCLSSRIPVGQVVTVEKLEMVSRAESLIRQVIGVRELRVRHDDGTARIEVLPEERQLFFRADTMDSIDKGLREIGFSRVVLDLRGYSHPNGTAGELLLPMSNGKLE